MSGIGHLAPAFAAKSTVRTVPLWVVLVASETNDILSILFSATGIEPKVIIVAMDLHQGVKYLKPISSPWSHGLFMPSIWAIIAAALAFLCFRDRRISAMIGLIVFSHWILDFLMHSNLPVLFSDSPQVGLGLENTGAGFVFMANLDLLLLTIGVAIYINAQIRSRQNPELANV